MRVVVASGERPLTCRKFYSCNRPRLAGSRRIPSFTLQGTTPGGEMNNCVKLSAAVVTGSWLTPLRRQAGARWSRIGGSAIAAFGEHQVFESESVVVAAAACRQGGPGHAFRAKKREYRTSPWHAPAANPTTSVVTTLPASLDGGQRLAR